MITIEFFGPPASGKTFFYNKITKELKKKSILICSYDDLIFKYAFKEINFNILDYITLLYYSLIIKKKKIQISNLNCIIVILKK